MRREGRTIYSVPPCPFNLPQVERDGKGCEDGQSAQSGSQGQSHHHRSHDVIPGASSFGHIPEGNVGEYKPHRELDVHGREVAIPNTQGHDCPERGCPPSGATVEHAGAQHVKRNHAQGTVKCRDEPSDEHVGDIVVKSDERAYPPDQGADEAAHKPQLVEGKHPVNHRVGVGKLARFDVGNHFQGMDDDKRFVVVEIVRFTPPEAKSA